MTPISFPLLSATILQLFCLRHSVFSPGPPSKYYLSGSMLHFSTLTAKRLFVVHFVHFCRPVVDRHMQHAQMGSSFHLGFSSVWVLQHPSPTAYHFIVNTNIPWIFHHHRVRNMLLLSCWQTHPQQTHFLVKLGLGFVVIKDGRFIHFSSTFEIWNLDYFQAGN